MSWFDVPHDTLVAWIFWLVLAIFAVLFAEVIFKFLRYYFRWKAESQRLADEGVILLKSESLHKIPLALLFVLLIACLGYAFGIAAQILTTKIVTTTGVTASPSLLVNSTTIQWGIVFINQPVQKSLSIKNNGTVPLTLSMPSPQLKSGAITYSLTWDGEDTKLDPTETKVFNFTLTISAGNNGTHFEIDMTINGLQT